MRAQSGDRIVVPGRHVGDAVRAGQVLEVRGADGAPPYVVKWADGHQAVCWPPAEAKVERATASPG